MCIERYSFDSRARPRAMPSTTTNTSTTTRTTTNATDYPSWRCRCEMGSDDGNTPAFSNQEGMFRPVTSAEMVPRAVALSRGVVAAVCLLIAFCLWASPAHAHEIGLSVVELQVQQEHLSVQLTFAQSEVEA